MDAEDLGGDNGRDGQTVEHIDKRLPDLDVASPFAFVIEAIYCSILMGFFKKKKSVSCCGETRHLDDCMSRDDDDDERERERERTNPW
jgi:hypothetical protein